ncbi:hypothetical protein PS9374_04458 [Planomonospora sphaerica]|uniref:Uncharacterized protein n=1 Tax=Planomonospora sphaerica TaxID=161355 RepID=A0A161MCA5_9ACTN|nr:hypothetical protein PS9374_04458 [Planomonospora sphaerica]
MPDTNPEGPSPEERLLRWQILLILLEWFLSQ